MTSGHSQPRCKHPRAALSFGCIESKVKSWSEEALVYIKMERTRPQLNTRVRRCDSYDSRDGVDALRLVPFNVECERRNRFSGSIECLERNTSCNQRRISPITLVKILETECIAQSCHNACQFGFDAASRHRFKCSRKRAPCYAYYSTICAATLQNHLDFRPK